MAAEVQGWAWATGDMTELAMCMMPPGGTLVLRQHSWNPGRVQEAAGLGLLLPTTRRHGGCGERVRRRLLLPIAMLIDRHSNSPSSYWLTRYHALMVDEPGRHAKPRCVSVPCRIGPAGRYSRVMLNVWWLVVA